MNIKDIFRKFIMDHCDNILVILVLAVTAYYLFSTLHIKSLENDELFTLNMLTKNNLLDIIITGNIFDVHPTLYHIFMFFYTRIFEVSEYMIRVPSVIFFLISAYLSFIFAKKIFSATDGVISVIIIVILIPHACVSQFARGYSLLLMFTVITMICLVNIIQYKNKNPGKNISHSILICYIINAVFCIHTHYYGAILIFFELLFLFMVFNKKIIREIIIIITLLIILYLPWLLIIYLDSIKQECPDFLGWIIWNVDGNYNVFVLLFLIFIPLLPLIFDFIKYRNIKLLYDKYLYVLMLFFLFLVPYLSVFCLYNLGITCYQPKYLIIAIIPFYILIAHGIVVIGKRKSIIFLLTIIFVMFGIKQKQHDVSYLKNSEYTVNFIINNHNKTGRPILFIDYNRRDNMFVKYYQYHCNKYLNNKKNVKNCFNDSRKVNQTIEELSSNYGNNYIWVLDCTLAYDIKLISDRKNVVIFNDNIPNVYLVKNK